MLMKVFNKGQIVIPAAIRKALGIEPGDQLAFEVDMENRAIVLKSPRTATSSELAGSLAAYARKRSFPSKEERGKVLAEGFLNESKAC